ncbi:NAD(P)/FAD-dependent oxidoreductase [Flexivirga meconopsidis]|uniref:NAD(P)/FAD-dependent oxidoreductase n=1 Tax=Flexivirga meconopsidis TaxID=2977121 RepID=UPI00223EB231|nr:FAD-dependent oxidoreductase [Flexivirga meconopsidis]
MPSTIAIVGASLAGAHAASALRDRGHDGAIVLVGAEKHLPYQRPGLSKGYLLGKDGPEELLVHPEDRYRELDVDLRLGTRVTAVDTASRRLAVDDGDDIVYDQLLIATGARPRTPALPGIDLDGVHYLRTIDDSDALRARLAPGVHLTIVGAGWVGSEVAATARSLGAEVTVLDPLTAPLESVLGAELGRAFGVRHTDNGVDLRAGRLVTGIDGKGGRVTGVRTDGGDVIDTDLVLIAVGAEPNTELAQRAGIRVDRGVLVDDQLRTSAPEVYAAGDVVRADHPRYVEAIRVEHWDNAMQQGGFAGSSMLGADGVYERVPYFFSTQYDVTIEVTGRPDAAHRLVVRGDPTGSSFMAFWLQDNVIEAGLNANSWGAADSIRSLIESRAQVDAAALADESVPLDELGQQLTTR